MNDVQAGQLHGNYVADDARVRAKDDGVIVALKERLSVLWPAACFAGISVLRDDRNGVHRVHRLEGMDVATG
jgi:hypothetical protein